jgi:ABC-type amino acid transport substrate-binding protein
VLYDEVQLAYAISDEEEADYVITPVDLGEQYYSFAINYDSPYARLLDTRILRLVENGVVEDIEHLWINR